MSFDWSSNTKIKNPVETEIADLSNILHLNFEFLKNLFSQYTLFYPNLSESMFRFNEKSYWDLLKDFGLLSRKFTPNNAADLYHEVVILHVSRNNSSVSVSHYVDANEKYFESMDYKNKLLSPSQFSCLLIYLAETIYRSQTGSLASKLRYLIQQLQLKIHILTDNNKASTLSLIPTNIVDPFLDNMNSLALKAKQSDIYDLENFIDTNSFINEISQCENSVNPLKEREALSDFLELNNNPSDDILLFEFNLPGIIFSTFL